MIAEYSEGPALSFERMSVISLLRNSDPYLSKLSYKLMGNDILNVNDLKTLGSKGLKTRFNVHPKTIARVKKVFRRYGERFK